ncbi:MAG: glycosyltransferase family 2 protein [Candidatus Competibacteraceae bacterium]|nr:glycosyltransferase family 2 protein [Candidatus Competibacteraceae bacterium]
MAEAPIVSIVIPVFREGAHLSETLKRIAGILDSTGESYEILLVDDGSPDNTWEEIIKQTKRFNQVRGIKLSRNFGKEAALAAGLENVSGAAVLVMDGDLQHPPDLIPVMIRHWREGFDVVEAVKQSRGDEATISRFRAQVFYTLFIRLTGVDLHGASDFKLMDRRVLDAWRRLGERNLFFRGMNAWLGFKRIQIPFDVADRVVGKSGWSVIQLMKLALTAVTSFSSVPLYMMIFIGLIFSVFALIIGFQTVYLKFSGHAVDGFTTVILLVLIVGGLISFGLGLIGIYIARIYDEVKGRPRYIIAEQVD